MRARVLLGFCVVGCTTPAPAPVSPPAAPEPEPTLAQEPEPTPEPASPSESPTPASPSESPTSASPSERPPPASPPESPTPRPWTIPGDTTDICERINRDGEIPLPTNAAIPDPIVVPPLVVSVPLSARQAADVWRRVLDISDPPWASLKRTRWARRDGRPGCTRVRFCVAPDGSVESVETILPFRGDPGVDKIVVTTVTSWRFRPLDDADAEPACTTRTFRIQVPNE